MKADLPASEGSHHEGAVHVHVHHWKLYVGVFAVLVFLTIVTVLTSEIDIDGFVRPGTPHGTGGLNFLLAMVIATAKAACVCTWFMHLKDDQRFNALIFVGSVLFVSVFFAYTFNDTGYRGQGDPYNGVQVRPDTGERAPGGIEQPFPGEEVPAGLEPATGAESGHAGESADGPGREGGEQTHGAGGGGGH